jgi:hypothetical protein
MKRCDEGQRHPALSFRIRECFVDEAQDVRYNLARPGKLLFVLSNVTCFAAVIFSHRQYFCC